MIPHVLGSRLTKETFMAAIYNFLKPHPIILQRVGLGVGIPLTATVFERMYRGKSTLSTSLLA
jgi:hypothetical protein